MKKTLILTLILFILFAGSAWLLLSPPAVHIREVRGKILRARAGVEKLRRLYRQSKEMEKKAAVFQKDIQYLSSYLPGQAQINGILNDIRSRGMEYGLNMVKADSDYSFLLEEPGPSRDEDALMCLETIPFNLQAEAALPDICSYLEWLEGLPCFFSIDHLEISRLDDRSSPFPLLRVNLLLKVLGFSRKGKDSVGYFQKKADIYYPVRLSPALVTAQKNLRIAALEKDLFSPEGGVAGTGAPLADEYQGSDESAGEKSTEEVESEPQRGEKSAASIRDLDLNGIVNFQGEYTALIDNRRVKKGDIIIGMEVMWITKDSICLAQGSDKFILRLNK